MLQRISCYHDDHGCVRAVWAPGARLACWLELLRRVRRRRGSAPGVLCGSSPGDTASLHRRRAPAAPAAGRHRRLTLPDFPSAATQKAPRSIPEGPSASLETWGHPHPGRQGSLPWSCSRRCHERTWSGGREAGPKLADSPSVSPRLERVKLACPIEPGPPRCGGRCFVVGRSSARWCGCRVATRGTVKTFW